MLNIVDKRPILIDVSQSSGGPEGDTPEVVLARFLGVDTSDIRPLGAVYYVELGDMWTPPESFLGTSDIGIQLVDNHNGYTPGYDFTGQPIPRSLILAFRGSITIE